MIIDRLSNAALYQNLHPNLAAALQWLRTTDLDSLPLGKTVIDGEDLFALVQEYAPKDAALAKFEAHRDYWDVQQVVKGEERMGYANLADATECEAYDTERDVAFFTACGYFVRIPAGAFVIFSPQDVHMPGVSLDDRPDPGLVRKVVVKVRVRNT